MAANADGPLLFDARGAAEPEGGAADASGGYALVALEQGIDFAPDGLTYAVPGELADLAEGERVLVPLGKGDNLRPGHVVGRPGTTDRSGLKAVARRDPHGIALPSDLVALGRWMSAYYCAPLGMVFATMLPAAVKQGAGQRQRVLVALARAEEAEAAEDPDAPKGTGPAPERKRRLSKIQRRALDLLEERAAAGEPWIELHALADEAGARTPQPVRGLLRRGLLRQKREPVVRAADPLGEPDATGPPPEATEAQQRAVASIGAALGAGYSAHLLHGVTGSGKTEVYLRLIGQMRASASADDPPGAIVLVPEISLTPQTVGRFVGRFGDVAVLHSGLTSAQRHEQWRRIRDGTARIVVGARSAVFAPVRNLGLIVVDEEHEGSYKQEQLPRYHARDVAVKRAHLLGIPAVLGSATPSLESYHNATARSGEAEAEATPPRYRLHRLPERVAGMRMPEVEIVDLVEERRRRKGLHLISERLERVLAETIAGGGQALLLLNRRGYANYLACPDHRCGWQMLCDHCDAMMVYHKHETDAPSGYARCHHCTAEKALPKQCPACGKKVTVFGLGTQRVEEELSRKLPQARRGRMDADVMRTARDYRDLLDRFREKKFEILVGTQMIAKGLDIPNVRAVGVVSADTGLHMPDFRAEERTFQLVAQVAGRAGRLIGSSGGPAGRVIVQSLQPHNPAIELASGHDYEGFAERELGVRRDAGLPPYARMSRIVVRDPDAEQCRARGETLRAELDAAAERAGVADRVRIVGPAPCPIARIADHHRHQIELTSPTAGLIQRVLADARNRGLLRSDARTAVDVDPVSLL